MIYRVEMMTQEDHFNYMCGGNDYGVYNLNIEANSKEEAIKKAKEMHSDWVANEGYVLTLEEWERQNKK